MKKKLLVFCSLMFVASFTSCTKEFIEKNTQDEKIIVNDSVNIIGKKNDATKGFVVYSNIFDWENLNTISTPYGTTLLPWYGSNLLPQRMLHNHPKSEGWEMLYNTMDISGLGAAPTFFALYNKYSGVMHLFYIQLTYLESSEAFYTALGLTGNTSILNFEGKLNSGQNTKFNYPTIVKGTEGTISPFNSSTGTPLQIPDGSFVFNTWYGTEIEFAYEDVSSFSDINFYLQYLPFRGNYSSLSLTGKLDGTIKGTIEAKTSGNSNLIGTLGNIFNTTNSSNSTDITLGDDNIVSDCIIGSVEKAKNQATPTFFQGLWAKIQHDIPTAVQSDITNTLKSAVSAGIKWATNPLSAFVNSVFSVGASGSNIPLNKVDLKTKADIKLSGSIASQLANMKFDLKLPNTISEMGGYGYPTYDMKDWNLGVWNVNLPIVYYNITNTIYTINGAAVADPQKSNVSINISSLGEIVINPRVANDCYITQQKLEYIIETSDYDNKNSVDYLEPFGFRTEKVGTISPVEITIQQYIFPKETGIIVEQPRHVSNYPCGYVIFARVTVVLTHKTTGKEFVHIKDFPLTVQSTLNYVYEEYGSGGEGQ